MPRKSYYKAVLFAPDGDWVTDYADSKSIEEVWEHVENMGSRWIFYPIVFVVQQKNKWATFGDEVIVSTAEEWKIFLNKSIAEVSKALPLHNTV